MTQFLIEVSVPTTDGSLIPPKFRLGHDEDEVCGGYRSFSQIPDDLAATSCLVTTEVMDNGYKLGQYIVSDSALEVRVTATSRLLIVHVEKPQSVVTDVGIVKAARLAWQAHMEGIRKWVVNDHAARLASVKDA